MYSNRLLHLLLWLQCSVFAHAQRGLIDFPEVPVAEPIAPAPRFDSPAPRYDSPAGLPDSPGEVGTPGGSGNIHIGEDGLPPTKPVGVSPAASPNDAEINVKEIGDQLHDLIDHISSLVDGITSPPTSTSTATDDSGSVYTTVVVQTATRTTSPTLPTLAAGCTSAQAAYATCSQALQPPSSGAIANANFTAVPATQQASCLCNAAPSINFNSLMKNCYDWTHAQQNQTNGSGSGSNPSLASQFGSYASAIASGTTLCGPYPSNTCLSLPGGNEAVVACEEGAPADPTSSPSSTTSASTGGAGGVLAPGRGGNGWVVILALMLALTGGIMSFS